MEANLAYPDVIIMSAEHTQEIPADRADLVVSVQGSSLFTGGEALKQAKEVKHLVRDLKAFGLQEEDISLEGVAANVSKGFLGKSSSALYWLRVRCRKLEDLSQILGIVTEQKNVTLNRIDWRYPDDQGPAAEALAACIKKARRKAEAAAAALGVAITGIHKMYPGQRQQFGMPMAQALAAPAAARAYPGGGVDLGFDLAHSKRTVTVATVEFHIEQQGG
jgi:uncharacterized protein YggE